MLGGGLGGCRGNEVWFDWLVSFVVGYRRLAAIMLRKEKKATKPIKLNVLCFLFFSPFLEETKEIERKERENESSSICFLFS